MPTQTEAPAVTGAPSNNLSSNGSLAVGKTDTLRQYRLDELARLMLHPGFELLRTGEVRVLRYVVKKCLNKGMGIFASQATIADAMGLHEKTVSKALRAIVRAGLFTSEHRGTYNGGKGGRTSNRYRLVASEGNIQGDSLTSPDSITRLHKSRANKPPVAGTLYVKGELEEVKALRNKDVVLKKKPAKLSSVPSQIMDFVPYVMGKVEEGEEQAASQQPAASIFDYVEYEEEELGLLLGSQSLAALNSPTRVNTSGLVGIEPPRPEREGQMPNQTEMVEGVIAAPRTLRLGEVSPGRYVVTLQDGREFSLKGSKALEIVFPYIGRHVRFPVWPNGALAGRPELVETEAVARSPERAPRAPIAELRSLGAVAAELGIDLGREQAPPPKESEREARESDEREPYAPPTPTLAAVLERIERIPLDTATQVVIALEGAEPGKRILEEAEET